jgi:hypothetical protein
VLALSESAWSIFSPDGPEVATGGQSMFSARQRPRGVRSAGIEVEGRAATSAGGGGSGQRVATIQPSFTLCPHISQCLYHEYRCLLL